MASALDTLRGLRMSFLTRYRVPSYSSRAQMLLLSAAWATSLYRMGQESRVKMLVWLLRHFEILVALCLLPETLSATRSR